MAQQEDQERTAGAALTEAKMEGYLEKLAEKGCAPGTLTLYRTNIEKFLQWLNGTPLDPGSATRWRDHLLALGRMPRTVNLQLSPINGLLAHLKLWDYQAPTLLCLEEDAQPELRREEYLRLLAAAKARGNRRVYLAVKVFACLGLNVHELPLLTVEAVASGSVPLADGPPRSLPRCLQRELEEYIQDMGIPAGPVFVTRSGKPMSRTSVTTAIQHLAKSAGVEPEKCNPRCLRKLYLATLQGFQRQVMQLVEQAHNSLVEQEQAVVGWSVGQAGPWHGKESL